MRTMNDRYGAFDMDSFGNGQQTSQSSTIPVAQHQRYMANNGPCMDDYDPSRMLNLAAYNPTTIGTGMSNRLSATHQMMMPHNGASALRMSSFQGGFQPLQLDVASLQRINNASSNTPNIQSAQTSRLVTDDSRDMTYSPLSDIFGPPTEVKAKPNPDLWLEEMHLTVSGISLEPLSGMEVLKRVQLRTDEVISRYLPCVDFLVACQQELRRGLAAASQKRLVHGMLRDALTPRQFYNSYVANLPERFYRKQRRIMKTDDLKAAVKELEKLCSDAKAVERQGCDAVKNAFLGGMKDGESWGLRKWLSKHGGALHICNDIECILHACQKLDRSLDSTRKLSHRLRPLAKKSFSKLKTDVPASYQEHSSAHPYLPFFHRLEAALRGMSNFDPEDDDVICIDDDDEVEELKAQAAVKAVVANTPKKRKAAITQEPVTAPARASTASNSDTDEDSVIEILDSKRPRQDANKVKDAISSENGDGSEYMKELLTTFDDDQSTTDLFNQVMEQDNLNLDMFAAAGKDSFDLAAGLDRLAVYYDQNQHNMIRPSNIPGNSFWDGADQYACALRLFSEILRSPESSDYLESIDEGKLLQAGGPPYSSVIRHPLSFREIVTALIEETDDMDKNIRGCNGTLNTAGLSSWNMWRGNDLLQAIDLVFLNSLAYGKATDEGRSSNRSTTNKLRKLLWAGIKKVIDSRLATTDVESRRKCTPTRRGESSGFVVRKA